MIILIINIIQIYVLHCFQVFPLCDCRRHKILTHYTSYMPLGQLITKCTFSLKQNAYRIDVGRYSKHRTDLHLAKTNLNSANDLVGITCQSQEYLYKKCSSLWARAGENCHTATHTHSLVLKRLENFSH